ncbi:MAG: NTP transferase domain-containing protein [Alkalispirochaeta sp.]
MKLIVLAAGQGTRLRPLTDNIPKCMVPLEGTPLLERQLATAREVGLTDLHVATGYREDAIDYPGVTKHYNPDYDSTNMVATLFCAEEIMDDDLIVAYGDIVYQPDVLQALIDDPHPVGVVVDREWQRYWAARQEDPLIDAETMKLRDDDTIIELGKKPKSLDEVQGQYIGLMKFSREALQRIRPFYHGLDRDAVYDGKDYPNMYMTSFLQLIADNLMPLHAVFIRNGWMEIDAPSDLAFTDFLYRRGPAAG